MIRWRIRHLFLMLEAEAIAWKAAWIMAYKSRWMR